MVDAREVAGNKYPIYVVDVLGTLYEIRTVSYESDKKFEKDNIDGYCNGFSKEIILCDMDGMPGFEDYGEAVKKAIWKCTLRHELIHAFLNESGLNENSGITRYGWAVNEEMIEWIAIQFPKMKQLFVELDIA